MKKAFKQIDKDLYIVNFPEETKEVFFDIYLKKGYSSENNNKFGWKHLLEHYLIESVGDSFEYINGSIGQDYSNYYIKSNNRKAVKDIEKFLDKVLNPVFNDFNLLEREKKVIENEMKGKEKNKEKSFNFILKKIFGNKFPQAREKRDQIKNIRKITLNLLQKYHENVFNEKDVFFVLSGFDLDKKNERQLIDLVRKYKLSRVGLEKKEYYSLVKKGIYKNSKFALNNNSIVNISFELSKKSRESPKDLLVLSMIKNYFENSDYYFSKKLRERGVYTADFDKVIWNNSGVNILSTTVDEKDINFVIKEFIDFVDKIKKNGIEQEDLNKLKNSEKEVLSKSFANNYKRLSWIVNDLLFHGEVITLKEEINSIKEIDSFYIKKVAKRIFNFQKMNLIILAKDQKNIKLNLENKKIFSIK